MSMGGPLSLAGKLTVASLLVAVVGVTVQIVSRVSYPTIPPVFFILSIPAGLIAFGRWRWTPMMAVPAGLFLTVGLVPSGSSARLFDASQMGGLGGTVGLWVQTLAVIVATAAAIVATYQNYRIRPAAVTLRPEAG